MNTPSKILLLLALLFPSTLFAATSYDLLAPILGTSTLTSLKDYLLLVFRAAIGLAGVLAVVMIVICGVKLMGNPSSSGKSEAKECIWNAIFGVILVLGSWLLLNTINPLLLNNDITLIGIASAPTATITATTEPDPTAPGFYFKYKDNNSGDVKFSRSNTDSVCEEIRAKNLADTVNYTVLSDCYEIVAGFPPPPIPPSTPLGSALLSILKDGMGEGTVTGTGINCGTDCSETYSGSPTITLSATPKAGSTFTGWFGGGCSGNETCEVSMIKNREVKATFASSFGGAFAGGSSLPPTLPPTLPTLPTTPTTGDPGYGSGLWGPLGMPNRTVADHSSSVIVSYVPGCLNGLFAPASSAGCALNTSYTGVLAETTSTRTVTMGGGKELLLRYMSSASAITVPHSGPKLREYDGGSVPASTRVWLTTDPTATYDSVSSACKETGTAGRVIIGPGYCPIIPNTLYYFGMQYNGPGPVRNQVTLLGSTDFY